MIEAAPPIIEARASLFLDFDGTLVPLADRPDAVAVPASLQRLLARLSDRLAGRVAIVSGRSIQQLDDLLGAAASSLGVVGSHGAEVRTVGSEILAPERPPSLAEAEELFKSRFGANSQVIIEVKSLGVAIHYRLDPSAEAEAAALADAFCARSGLEIQQGKMMVEVRLPGFDKGTGIAALMQTAPFSGHAPYFLGDDITDESGFAWCAAAGGAGILVGPHRASAARYRLSDVAAVLAWLEAL